MPRTKQTNGERKTIQYGSEDHRVILGIDNDQSPEEKAKLDAALKAKPIPMSHRDVPWKTRRGEDAGNGWVRRGG